MSDPVDDAHAYVIDTSDVTEGVRLVLQSQLFTRIMGGLFPPDLSVPPHARVLDLASGPGQWAIEVAATGPERCVVGVDLDAGLVRYANATTRARGHHNLSFEQMDLKAGLDFPNASFDVINGRFLVGFLDPDAWIMLLNACWHALAPGGVLILSECEMGISSSAALQALAGAFTRALQQQRRTFSVDGHSIGIVHQLGGLMQQAGFREIEQQPFVLDSSAGSPVYEMSRQEANVTYALLRPYVLASGVLDAATYDELYRWMQIEIQYATFRSVSFGLRVWGFKEIA